MFRNSCTIVLLLCLAFVSCEPEVKGNPDRFKTGQFEIPAGESFGKTYIQRIDSLQIESYSKKVSATMDSVLVEKEVQQIDTLYIKWKNNFAYSLRMKNPKTELDKDPIFVQITKVTDSSYEFTAKIGYSNFKNKGIVYKVK
ncbi:hypothetical protein [Tenacibaculum sp. SG-28]|uniref:hypothetical protein n=1 Tax=Tenacibaculum sp. SG-28 TaxID=754426 RepID=UPI000CF575C1|nr:hypothetical protein [Tenacibaculum sp. SG-28]PQJ23218.1 hypothetical protein BSU00_03045 [Tenacibaculum sp. SG-28]